MPTSSVSSAEKPSGAVASMRARATSASLAWSFASPPCPGRRRHRRVHSAEQPCPATGPACFQRRIFGAEAIGGELRMAAFHIERQPREIADAAPGRGDRAATGCSFRIVKMKIGGNPSQHSSLALVACPRNQKSKQPRKHLASGAVCVSGLEGAAQTASALASIFQITTKLVLASVVRPVDNVAKRTEATAPEPSASYDSAPVPEL